MDFNGSKANNIVVETGPCDVNRGVFCNLLDSKDGFRDYLMFGTFANDNGSKCEGLGIMESQDGIHWQMSVETQSQMEAPGDTANNILWNEARKVRTLMSMLCCMLLVLDWYIIHLNDTIARLWYS